MTLFFAWLVSLVAGTVHAFYNRHLEKKGGDPLNFPALDRMSSGSVFLCGLIFLGWGSLLHLVIEFCERLAKQQKPKLVYRFLDSGAEILFGERKNPLSEMSSEEIQEILKSRGEL